MAENRRSDNSLERELAYEDLTIKTGDSSKARRDMSQEQKAKKKEEIKQVQTKAAMLQAGESSRIKRRGHQQ